MKTEFVYVVSAYRDLYKLPLAVFDSEYECADYIGCSVRAVQYVVAGVNPHILGYKIEKVEL